MNSAMVKADMDKKLHFTLDREADGRFRKERRGSDGREDRSFSERERTSFGDHAGHEKRRLGGVNHPLVPARAEPPRGEITGDHSHGSFRNHGTSRGGKGIDFQDPVGSQDSAVAFAGSARDSSSLVTPSSFAQERFRHETIGACREELDINGHPLPPRLEFSGPQPRMVELPRSEEGFVCSESNALAFVQAMANACPRDRLVYRHDPRGRMM